MSLSMGCVVLAGGAGTRLKVETPKPLMPLLGQCLVDFPLQELLKFKNFLNQKSNDEVDISIVTGHQHEKLEAHLNNNYKDLTFAFQKEQKGTADALMTYFAENSKASTYNYTLVMCADTPLLKAEDLEVLMDVLESEGLAGVAATFITDIPYGLGRIQRGYSEEGFRIIEEKDATDDERNICEVNAGVYLLKTEFVLEKLKTLNSNNKANEFYLTDIFTDKDKVSAITFEDEVKFLGVNDLRQLEMVGFFLQEDILNALRSEGVRFLNSSSVIVEKNIEIGAGTIIYPNVVLEGSTKIGKNCIIRSGAQVINSVIQDEVELKAYSCITDSNIGNSASIGPFAHLRPNSNIKEQVKVGNFVELKNTTLEKGSKVSHLSYVGDAEIGEETNIGCGFITCNYDGANKHFTKIGKGSFIGSDTQVIAPLSIGNYCYIGSGSTINRDVPDGAFAIARAKQENKEGLAKRFIKKKN